MNKFAHLEEMEAATFKAMMLRCIYLFDKEPLDKARPFGMAAAALYIANGCAECNADKSTFTLEECSTAKGDTGDWKVTVQRLPSARRET